MQISTFFTIFIQIMIMLTKKKSEYHKYITIII